ncbi:penicillin-binding protein 1C [Allofranklinella schreckenbergeri]|uniref:peptidoglycan glycosyltransferase n=1 Tax=Allofranklinella schreckenbergeri TaxID=1076744 RepID=A0A3M6QBD0_9BURK|nr:penicillin-binding protein 1C [Allofranklinella schreckenbergeri]RMX00155.1 penicillin-binding protein 1C [Allofranklinella schreckenbergeri]
MALALARSHALLAGALVAAVLGSAPSASCAHTLPSFAQVRADFHSSETWLLDRQGQRIQRVRTDFQARRGDWTALEDISPALLHAILLTEDKRFYEHSGVDWAAVGSAAWGNLWNERTRGASTITMQLAGLLNAELRARTGGRTWRQKWRQLWSARDLEAHWSKAEILEAYVNLAPFRGELIGIDSLARNTFGKAPSGLDAREVALTAALLRAPNAPATRVAERACLILAQAQSPWGQDCRALRLYTEAALSRPAQRATSGDAPHFARYVMRGAAQPQPVQPAQPTATHDHTPPANAARVREVREVHAVREIPSSLDSRLQRHAAQVLQQQVQALTRHNVHDGAALVLDNASGEVLAWVGTSGLSRSPEVDAVLGLRQPGSTLKPFLYAQAIAQKRLTAASLLEDSPTRIPTAFGLYAPENYDQSYKGWVSVRQALGSSLNIPAVRTLRMVSPESFAQLLRALELHLPEPAGYYGYALALGGVDANLLQLTNAYRTLANGGLHSPIRTQVQPLPTTTQATHPGANAALPVTSPTLSLALSPDSRRVLDAPVAYIVGDILSDRHARLLTFGTDSALATRFWSAVKTGTSQDMRDNWAIGYTPHFTIGVWVGNADGSPMHNVSGIAGAAPVWASIAAFAHRLRPGQRPAPPPELVRLRVRYLAENTGENDRLSAAPSPALLLEAERDEWFLPGTEQAQFTLRRAPAPALAAPSGTGAGGRDPTPARPDARILEPADGTILALDPDIPPTNQMLRIASNHPAPSWWLNGQRVSGLQPGHRHWYWPPTPGRHTIELRSASGQRVIDRVRIEVRGASLKP